MKNLLADIHGPGRPTQIPATTGPDHLWPEMWSDGGAGLGGEYFADPGDKEFKETIENARKRLELPMEAALLCKLKTFWYRKLVANPTTENQSMHASWKLTSLPESVWKELYRKILKITLLGRGSTR